MALVGFSQSVRRSALSGSAVTVGNLSRLLERLEVRLGRFGHIHLRAEAGRNLKVFVEPLTTIRVLVLGPEFGVVHDDLCNYAQLCNYFSEALELADVLEQQVEGMRSAG